MNRSQKMIVVLTTVVGVAAGLNLTASKAPAGQGAVLPWPACAPDAVPPDVDSVPSLPESEPFTGEIVEERETLDPVVDLLIKPSTVAPTNPADESGMQDGVIEVREVIWKSAFRQAPSSGLDIVAAEEALLSSADEEFWTEILQEIAAGGEVIVGLDAIEGASGVPYRIVYAIVPESAPRYLGPEPFASRDTEQLHGFMKSELFPLPSESIETVLKVWNVQTDAPGLQFPAPSALDRAFSQFWKNTTVGEAQPPSGTSWRSLPENCRSLLDAPKKYLAELQSGELFMQIPASWASIHPQAVFCLKTQAGGLGCIEPNFSSQKSALAHWDQVYAEPNSQLIVEMTVSTSTGVSWVDRMKLATLDSDALQDGPLLIELPSGPPPQYVPGTDLSMALDAAVTTLTQSERSVVLRGVPEAELGE